MIPSFDIIIIIVSIIATKRRSGVEAGERNLALAADFFSSQTTLFLYHSFVFPT